jgi:N-acetylmuramoyl-L-alanine amidase
VRTIRRGDRGPHVRDVQSRLGALGFRIDPGELESQRFDASTDAAVRTFQQERGLLVDASIGPSTWQELVEAGYALGDRVLYLRYPYFRGDDVRALQRRLNVLGFDPGREDGIFGEQTGGAVGDFQRNVGLDADGIVGSTTLDALDRLRPPMPGPGRTAIRESESLRATAPLTGRRVAIDVGHGPGDPGGVGPTGVAEAEAAYRLAERLSQELEAHGSEPVWLRAEEENPSDAERVARAKASGADALVSVHLNSHEDPAAEGSSSYYFGRLGSVSVPGKALAEMIQETLSSRTGVPDGRTHPMSFPLLRETPMPAVQVEPGFITNPKEERLLSEVAYQTEVARALVDALERFFAGRS